MAEAKGDTFKLVVRLDKELVKRFRIRCIREGISMQAGAARALAAWLWAGRERRTRP